MALPVRLSIHDCSYVLDGGTYRLRATDERNAEHRIILAQHARPSRQPEDQRIPGRLYFDGELVPIRSQLETDLLRLLKAATVIYAPREVAGATPLNVTPHAIMGEDIKRFLSGPPEETLRRAIRDVVGFVESEAYVDFARRQCETD